MGQQRALLVGCLRPLQRHEGQAVHSTKGGQPVRQLADVD